MTTQTEALKLALEAYLCREMPAGTVIGDPKWWVPKIANAIKEALAQQSNEQVEPVAMNVTIEGDAAKLLASMLEPALDGDDPTPIRLMVGNGHSGYGIYVADDEYPEEGANLLINTHPPAPTAQPKEQESKWLEMQCPICGDMAIPAPTAEPEQEQSDRFKDFPTNDLGEPIIYDTNEIDEITGFLTGDEGEEDSVTVLHGLVRYLNVVHPNKTMIQVLIETEEAALAEQPKEPAPEWMTEEEQTAYVFGWFKALEARHKEPEQEPQPPYEFERYVAGSLRAQGVMVERATTLADAMRIAAKICPPANIPSAPTVLVYTTPPQRKPLTDEAAMFAAQHMFLEWNRRHDERLVKVAYEYGVFQKAIELYNEAYRIAKGNA